ncbi:MAG: hypothetical protein R3F07_04795 [Opitutaceae bacterium]
MKQKTTFIQAVFPSHHGGASLFMAYQATDLQAPDREERTVRTEESSENTLLTRVRSSVAGLFGRLTRVRTPRIRARAPQAG